MQIDNPKTLIKSYTMISNNGLKQIVHLLIRGVGAEMALAPQNKFGFTGPGLVLLF